MHPAPLGQNDIFGNRFARQRPVFFNLNLKVVPGSSPATSLAADLSQNFHIDNEARLVARMLADTEESLLTSTV